MKPLRQLIRGFIATLGLFLLSGLPNAKAQIIFSENFEGGIIPNSFTLINNDGLTPATNVNYVTNAWVARPDFDDPTDTVAVSTSWYSPAGAADDWLITPAITLGANSILEWNAKAQDPAYPDGYQVRVSTTTPTVAGFLAQPILMTQNPEQSVWTARTVNLTAYANQTVYLAFRNNSNDKFLLLIDDIVVRNPSSTDARVLAVADPGTSCELSAADSVYALIENYGSATISNFNVSYSINGGAPVTETYTGSITSGSSVVYAFNTTANFSTPGNYQIKVYTTVSGDVDVSNDTAYSAQFTNVASVPANGYTNDFESTLLGWTLEDANADNNSWFPVTGISNSDSTSLIYVYNTDGTTPADDWLFSTCLDFDAGKTYRLEFYYAVGSDGSGGSYPEKLEVYYGMSANSGAMTNLIQDLGTITDTSYQLFSQTFTPSSTGTHYIGFHAYSDADMYFLSIDDVSIVEEQQQGGGCDTLTNIDLVNDNITFYTIDALLPIDSGYISGHNIYGDVSKADFFANSNSGYQVTGAYMFFAHATTNNPGTSTITAAVWDATGSGGSPGNMIASQTILINDIISDITNLLPTYVQFSPAATVNGNYYVGITFDYNTPGDTVVLYTNSVGETTPSTAWEEWDPGQGGGWSNYDDSYGPVGLAHAVFPIICSPNTGCPTITIATSSTNTGCTGNTGSATASASGGQSPYTYAWSNGGSTATISNVGAGSYTVTVTDFNGCQDSTSVTVNATGAPTITLANKGDVSCNGGSNGFASVNASGGTTPYTYNWGGGNTNATYSNLAAGTYTVTVTGGNSCSATFSVQINEPAALAATVAGVTNVACPGGLTGAVDISVSGGTSPYTYAWSNTATTQDISGVASGTYTVTVTDANSCTTTQSATVTAPANPLTVSVNTTASDCTNPTGSATANASGGNGGYTYNWSNSATTQTINNIGAGTYTVTVIDNGGCSVTASGSVTNTGAPTVSATATPVTCPGGTTGAVSLNVSGGSGNYSYSWSPGGATSQNISNVAAGSYMVTVTDNNNNCAAITSATVSQPPAFNVSVTQLNVTCFGGSNGSATASVTGGNGGYTYQWTTNPVQNTATATGLSAGQYILNVSDNQSCAASPVTVTITQPSPFSATVNVVNVTCNGASNGTATVVPTGGSGPNYSYSWSNSATSSSINGLAPNTYTVTVTDANNCTTTASGTVTQPTTLTATASATAASCNGVADGTLSSSGNGGTPSYTYNWSNSITSQNQNTVAAGSYTVTVTDGNNCTAQASATVTQPTAINVTASATNVSCSGGSNGTAMASANGGSGGGFTFAWSNGGSGASISGLTAGNYTVTVTDGGCTKTATATVGAGASISLTTGSTNESSNGANDGSASVTATGGATPYTYSWSNGGTTSTINNIGGGSYSVTVTDFNGCVASTSLTVTTSVGIADLNGAVMSLYPNPSEGVVTLDIQLNASETVKIEWYNVLGEQLISEDFSNTKHVQRMYDFSDRSNGIYFTRVTVDGRSEVHKVIISR